MEDLDIVRMLLHVLLMLEGAMEPKTIAERALEKARLDVDIDAKGRPQPAQQVD